jgi:hypothetical protein
MFNLYAFQTVKRFKSFDNRKVLIGINSIWNRRAHIDLLAGKTSENLIKSFLVLRGQFNYKPSKMQA